MTSEPFTIRSATINDAQTIAIHRTGMFQGRERCRPKRLNFCAQIAHWSSSVSRQRRIPRLAGASFERFTNSGSRRRSATTIAEGWHANILNVFTEPEWRRQGIARRLLQNIIDWARAERIESLVLHSSEAGRSLYERLGFIQTNEMRLAENKRRTSGDR